MSRQRDIGGQRFGAWRVVGPAERDLNRQARWRCLCDCGETAVVYQSALVSGASESCGCSQLGRRPIRVGRSTPPVVIAGAAAALFMPSLGKDRFPELVAAMRRSSGRRVMGSMS